MAIKAYIEIGQRKSASDLYKKLKKTLKEELNIEPSIEAKNYFGK